MKKIDIILARYNENIEWIKKYRDSFDNVFIFNKGDKLQLENNITVEDVSNIGREAHTYLYFLSNYYDKIEDDKIYVFSQAQPNNSVHTFMNKIKCLDENAVYPKSMTDFFGNESIFYETNDAHPNGLPIFQFFCHLFYSKELIKEHKIYYNALWATQGRDIKFRSKKFYDYCLNMISNNINPVEAYIFERMWHYIFDTQYLDWLSHYDKIREPYATGAWTGKKIE